MTAAAVFWYLVLALMGCWLWCWLVDLLWEAME